MHPVLYRLWTAGQSLYHPTRLDLVDLPQTVAGDEWVLVYGASCELAPSLHLFNDT